MGKQYSCCGRWYRECVVWRAKDPKMRNPTKKFNQYRNLTSEPSENDNSIVVSFARQTVQSVYHHRVPCYSYSIVSPWYIRMFEDYIPLCSVATLNALCSYWAHYFLNSPCNFRKIIKYLIWRNVNMGRVF